MMHVTAKPSHYDKESKYYDVFNEENTLVINQLIEKILKKYKVNTVLDLTCGTGLQVFYLAKRGYEVTGVDINTKMLSIAKAKLKKEKSTIKLLKGDMRLTKAGQFDAVITIANAIGHLTKQDFEKALKNINLNLKVGGIYIFDIFNLGYLLEKDNITKLTIDWQKREGNALVREIQYSTISEDGVLASYDIYHRQEGNKKPKRSEAFQTLQAYTARQLKDLLHKNGFKVLCRCDVDGSKFHEIKTERMLTVSQKHG